MAPHSLIVSIVVSLFCHSRSTAAFRSHDVHRHTSSAILGRHFYCWQRGRRMIYRYYNNDDVYCDDKLISRTPTSLRIHYDDFSDLAHQNDNPINGSVIPSFPKLQHALQTPPISYPSTITSSIIHQFISSGFTNDNDIIQFAKGFIDREEVLSRILIQDFGWKALVAHQARVGAITLVRSELHSKREKSPRSVREGKQQRIVSDATLPPTSSLDPSMAKQTLSSTSMPEITLKTNGIANETKKQAAVVETEMIKPALWKSVLVNDQARLRRSTKGSNGKGSSNGDASSGSRNDSEEKDSYNYGLLQSTVSSDGISDVNGDRQTYQTLYKELDNYFSYMTVPQTLSAVSDPPIREQTAKVYLTHARLFLGWMLDARGVFDVDHLLDEELASTSVSNAIAGDNDGPPSPSSPLAASANSGISYSLGNKSNESVRQNVWRHVLGRTSSEDGEATASSMKNGVSLYDIFPNSATESASSVLEYILWLRSERGISPNYEANILRGMIKLVKFRFAHEMSISGQPSINQMTKTSGGASKRTAPLDDLPIVIELRKLHREAGNKSKKAPRSSDEKKKWLEWSEYLEVIQLLKSDLSVMIDSYTKKSQKGQSDATAKALRVQRKEIATTYQQYLVLSFFASVPDRQRTLRELELNRNFIRAEEEGVDAVWVIKHSADDYKTGATYGDRPPLPLLSSLTPDIDDFLVRWRPALFRSSGDDESDPSFLFLQPRTGNPLTANSVYQIVSRCCYKYKQKKTNPHLLRDMIVTHVRKNADASEKELEALALFMGHSIQMQRESYDRRTMEQKVSPAVQLLQNMNNMLGEKNDA